MSTDVFFNSFEVVFTEEYISNENEEDNYNNFGDDEYICKKTIKIY